ncbi:MAG: TetR/AcrR family transcriptional regulator [Lachnospiraceae bacterium]|nr:TetR/AcrR family transcriptional regulator [Lachnospiraceae bacterium]
MPRDKTINHEKIIDAACKEFLEYGFQDASMRRIASECGMSASGLYKHFESKEDMFAALVDPAINGLYELYHELETENKNALETIESDALWSEQSDTVNIMSYVFDHIDEFTLIISKSQGTRYERFIHDVARLEEQTTIRYMKELKKAGRKVNVISRKEFHLLVTSQIEAMFQVVVHGFSRKEAIHYAETLDKFYLSAWETFFTK